MAFSLQLCLEGQHPRVATSLLTLRLVFCTGASHSSILVRTSLRCSVKGVEHSVVRDLQFLDNFSHGMAFNSQNKNKNRLTSLFLAILSL